MTKKQKITAVLALAFAFSLGMAVMCGCSYFTQEKVAEIHKTVGTILDIAYTSGGAVLVEQDRPARHRRQDHRSAGRNAERSRTAFLRGSAGETYGTFSQRRGRRSFRVKMKPGWELAFRPGFSFQQKWTIPHAVIRAQKPLWRRTVFLTIRGMRPGPAFAQHAP